MKKVNYKLEAIEVLKVLSKSYPNQLLSTHISLAFSDYPDYSWLSDKEFYFALEKYRCEKELDLEIPHSESIEDIIQDGIDLNVNNLEDEEEDY